MACDLKVKTVILYDKNCSLTSKQVYSLVWELSLHDNVIKYMDFSDE